MARTAARSLPQVVEDVDRDETREEKFCRLANRRVNHILHHVQTFKNLANRANYRYTDDQIERIFEVIDASLNEAKALFKRGRRSEFHL